MNTDAEGRLVLADAIVAASDEQPDAIVDVATLTGAQVVALGHRIAGLMGDDELVGRVRASADAVDESTWPMPLPANLLPLLKSDVADLANTKLGMTVPGMLLAGVFLQQFVGTREGSDTRIPWAHIDIAGPAHNSGGGLGIHGNRGDRSRRPHPRAAGRAAVRSVVGSYGRERRRTACHGDAPEAVRVADQVRKGDCGCPSRTLTLSSWAAEARAMPRRSAPSSSA